MRPWTHKLSNNKYQGKSMCPENKQCVLTPTPTKTIKLKKSIISHIFLIKNKYVLLDIVSFQRLS